MKTITAEMIESNMKRHYASYIFVVLIILAICGGCAGFCVHELTAQNILSIILLAVSAILVLLLIFSIFKTLTYKSHHVFRRYGSAADIAFKINTSAQNCRFYTENPANNYFLMITDTIITSSNFKDFLELSDIDTVSFSSMPEIKPVVLTGDPLSSLITTTAVRYVSNKAAPSEPFDYLRVKDVFGRIHDYSFRRSDLSKVISALS